VQLGVYVIMRKCPTAHLMLGYNNIWELRSVQFKWLLENISEEVKPDNTKKVIKKQK